MKIRTFALGSAAAIGIALVGVPAVAFTHHPSTPAERAQTERLNEQQLQMAQQAEAGTTAQTATNGQTATGSQTTPYDQTAANAQPSDQGKAGTYSGGASSQGSTDANGTSASEQAAMNGQAGGQTAGETAGSGTNAKTAMNEQTGTSADTQTGTSGSATASTSAGMASANTVELAQVSNPKQALSNASVESSTGETIGSVKKIVTGSNGQPQKLTIALNNGKNKTVSLDASQLRFDQSRKVVVAQLTQDEINSMSSSPQG